MEKSEVRSHICEQYKGALLNVDCLYCREADPGRAEWIPLPSDRSPMSITLPPENPIIKNIQTTTDPPFKKENILEEANRVTSGDRRKAYGKASKHLMLLARLWEPILGKEVQPIQVALCLLQLKVSRELHAHSRDNIVDIAGYARVIEMLFDGE